MARHARLALPQYLGQFADSQLRLAQDEQQAKPGRVPDGAEHREKLVHVAKLNIPLHINISLYAYAMVNFPAEGVT
jgi:hypothetical protein